MMCCMTDGNRDFGRIEFAGGRFEAEGMPVAALMEIRRFEVLVEEVARALYKRDHINRERTPRGFRSNFDLRVTRFDEGCVEAVLVRPAADASELSVDLDDYFDRSRKMIFDEIEHFVNRRAFSSTFPQSVQSRLAMFGRSLRDEESIGYSSMSDGRFARLDSESRRFLSELVSEVPETDEIVISGQITGLESEPHQVTVFLQEERRYLKGTFRDPGIWNELHALSGYQTRAPLVALSVLVKVSTAGELDAIEDIYAVQPALPARLAAQIESISQLADGWLDGRGSAISPTVIDRAEQLAESVGMSKYPDATIFPRADGGVQFEWASGEFEIEVLPDGQIIAYALSLERDYDGERTFSGDVNPERLLKWLFGEIN